MNPKKMSQSQGMIAVVPKKNANVSDLVGAAFEAIDLASRGIAKFASGRLAAKVQGFAYGKIADLIDSMEDTKKVIRDGIIKLVTEEGEVTSDKGTMQLTKEGWLFELRPHRTGYDAKKVEAALRARDLDPSEYMNATVTYSVNEDKLTLTEFTEEELEALKFDKSWSVQRPKPVD